MSAARNLPRVELTLWPAAALHGEIQTAQGEQLPHILEVRLNAAAGASTSSQVPNARSTSPSHAELPCQIENAMWSCIGPAGVFDVQLEASGYAPRYEWGMSLKAEENLDFGRTVLRRTTSVFGRAVRKDGSNPPGPCRAILRPDVERHGPQPDPERAPGDEPSFSVPLNQRGYFQVVGVLPGRHALTIACQEASGFRELVVQADGETRIDPPLQLEELTLDIAVTPKLDPEGRPWELTVDTTAPRYTRIANKVTTSDDGRWVRRGLRAGNYHVKVTSSDGTLWLQRYFDLGERSGPLALHLASVNVAGRVRLSMQPVRARLFFVNNAGGQSATLISGDDGRFQGVLPVTPDIHQNSSWTVDAHVSQPPVSQHLLNVNVPISSAKAWLDLELPRIAVRGNVVSADGQAQRGAQVTFENSNGIRTTTSTDNAGNFELPDLPPEKYTAVAASPEGVSDPTPFEVTQVSERELKFVLNPAMRIPFSVVSRQGPVPNATVQVWIAPGVPQAFAHTDQDGHFKINLPPGTTEVGLTVGAPGFALKLTRLKVSSDTDETPDANTITLDDTGAKLVLNFQPPGQTQASSGVLYLVHNGGIQEARTIPGWGSDQAGASGDGPATIDAIEPGKYALCSLEDPSQIAALWSGQPPSDRCSAGSVEEDETLTLSPPLIKTSLSATRAVQ